MILLRELFNKIYLFLYVKLSGVEREVDKIQKEYLVKDVNDITIDHLDLLSTGVYIDEQGQAQQYAKTMPDRFWKYFLYKNKMYDCDVTKLRNLLFMGQIPLDKKKEVIKKVAKSAPYRNRKGR